MFDRLIIKELSKWAHQKDRKPLVIRGARQVGKTTLINLFSGQFDHYIYVNLELPEDRHPFLNFTNIDSLVQALFFNKNKTLASKKNTLLFIDEIQEVPAALNILRYFYEQVPELAVIAAGSMLETLFNKDMHFPVGRVEYKVLRPVCFPEFLSAMGETTALQQMQQIPAKSFTHSKLSSLFRSYALLGGMPEVVGHYTTHKDLSALASIYDSLIISYLDDVEKYASNATQVTHIRHVIRTCFVQAGKRIKFAGFGNAEYRSREMGEALRTLEKALLIHLLYPNTGAVLPLMPDVKKTPRLQVLDTGMMNYFVGIQKEILGTDDLNNVYQGTMIEHLVGQELLSTQYHALSNLYFWARDKKESSAEVDYIFPFEGKLIPVEVKSGSEGKLKSLQIFMDMAPHAMAVRFYAGEISITKATTGKGKKYHLLNLPYYLVTELEAYLRWFEQEIKNETSPFIKPLR